MLLPSIAHSNNRLLYCLMRQRTPRFCHLQGQIHSPEIRSEREGVRCFRLTDHRRKLILDFIGSGIHLDIDSVAEHLVHDDGDGDENGGTDGVLRQLCSLLVPEKVAESFHLTNSCP